MGIHANEELNPGIIKTPRKTTSALESWIREMIPPLSGSVEMATGYPSGWNCELEKWSTPLARIVG